jgi:hypothetical protein
MRALFGLVAVGIVSVLGVIALADATKFEGQTEGAGSTQVVFSVDTKNYHHPEQDAARALWYACVSAVSWDESTSPRPLGDGVDSADGEYTAAVSPALGEDSRRRLRGCLEDATVDRISARVRSIETVDA